MWKNIAGAKRYSRPRGFNIAGASAPVAPSIPTPLLKAKHCPRAMPVQHFVNAGQTLVFSL